ncbi:hypothetical protein VNO78_24416 [Psophocarpus tetragonolobus]|uniref:non-specific serine/threonine protein kinase n=1 Tax=Psophocarpus tetragonolobus TaxID=3891 RepID=A0AAN9S537_PSOTE
MNDTITSTRFLKDPETIRNLILRDVTGGTTIWDSFSHPLDAGLAGMKIAVNRITGKKFEYVSWKSSSDPSSGYFSASLERLDAPEVFFWYNKTKPYWRTGPWNGTVFLGSPKMLKEYLYGWSFVPNENGLAYLTYKFEKPSMFGILSITPNGTLKLVEFMNRTIILKINQVELNKCEFYGTCGPFGSCDITLSPICTCFKGFEPSNPEEWKRENWTSGCKRNMPLNCGLLKNVSEVKSDGFLTYHNMKVPDFVERLVVDHDQDNCKADCLANCSCLAYAYDSYIGCMYWRGDLIDLQKFSDGGVDLFIRLPEQLLESKKGTEYRGFIIGIAGAIGALILAISAYLFWRKSTPKHTGSRLQNLIRRDPKQIKLDELPIFEFEKLAISTNNFHSNNMLGKGGFGPVYKAWKLWNEGKIMFMIDPEIQDPVFEKSMVRCIHIGLLCVQELAKERPTISSVVLMLISEITHLPPPRQVAFVQKQNCHGSESSQKSQFSSNNNVTLTDIQGR